MTPGLACKNKGPVFRAGHDLGAGTRHLQGRAGSTRKENPILLGYQGLSKCPIGKREESFNLFRTPRNSIKMFGIPWDHLGCVGISEPWNAVP